MHPFEYKYKLIFTGSSARYAHTASLLNDGRVLVVGGYDRAYLASAEIYDPGVAITTLSSNANPSVFGQSITLTAKVQGGVTAGVGSVNFYDGPNLLGNVALSAHADASLSTAVLGVGDHMLTAVYLADGVHAGSRSATLLQTVQAAPSQISITSIKPAAPKVGQNFVVRPVLNAGAGAVGVFSISMNGVTCTFNWPVQLQPTVQPADGCGLPAQFSGTQNLSIQFFSGTATVASASLSVPLNVLVDPNDVDGDGAPNTIENQEGLSNNIKDNNIFANTTQGRRLFVEQQYRDFLFREAAPDAVNDWAQQMEQGLTREQLILRLMAGPEATQDVQPLARIFLALFGHLNAALNINGFVGYARDLGLGVVTLDDCTANLLASPAFMAAFGDMDDAQFVQLVLTHVLGRSPDVGEINDALLTMHGIGRINYVRWRAEQADFVSSSADRLFVLWTYTGMVRRVTPVGAEQFWLGRLTLDPQAGRNELLGAYLGSLLPSYRGAATLYANRFLPAVAGLAQDSEGLGLWW